MLKKILLFALIFSFTILMIGCIPSTKADLVVQSFDDIDVNCGGVGPTVSCTTTVTFTIANIGVGDAGPFKILVRADPGLAQQSTVVVSGLTAGGTTSLVVPLPPGGNCYDPDCDVCITLDSDNEVTESNEENNDYCELTIG